MSWMPIRTPSRTKTASGCWGKAAFPPEITPGPEYIAPFVCYLASDAARDISGAVFSLGGNGIGMYSTPVIARNLVKAGREPWTVDELIQQAPRGLFTGYHSIADNPT